MAIDGRHGLIAPAAAAAGFVIPGVMEHRHARLRELLRHLPDGTARGRPGRDIAAEFETSGRRRRRRARYSGQAGFLHSGAISKTYRHVVIVGFGLVAAALGS